MMMMMMISALLTLHVEEGPCRVLPGAAVCPAGIVPLVGRLHGSDPQCPTLHHRPRRQRACGEREPGSPLGTVSPEPVPTAPSQPQRAPTEPLEGGRGVAGAQAAELGWLPRCHTQLRRLHGGGGGSGASCGEMRGGGLRVCWASPTTVPAPGGGGGGKQGVGVAQLAQWVRSGAPACSGQGAAQGPPRPLSGDSPGLCPSMNSTGP